MFKLDSRYNFLFIFVRTFDLVGIDVRALIGMAEGTKTETNKARADTRDAIVQHLYEYFSTKRDLAKDKEELPKFKEVLKKPYDPVNLFAAPE